MSLRSIALFCALVLAVACSPIFAFGETTETVEIVADATPPPVEAGPVVIVPDAPPPPSTDWTALLAIGSGAVFSIVELLKKNLPFLQQPAPPAPPSALRGWLVYASVLPVAAGVALYQVGYADPLLLAKHAGMLVLVTVGGRAALYKLIEKAFRREAPPEFVRSVSEPPVYQSKAPPS